MNKEEKKAIEDMNSFANGIDMSCVTARYLQILLNLLEKLQKENEELKEEKEQAWEEWNNLEQGSYETEQKLKQQIKELQKENEELKERIREHTLLISPYYVKENFIPVQRVKDKISERQFELQQQYKDFEDDSILIVLQELIEEREEK